MSVPVIATVQHRSAVACAFLRALWVSSLRHNNTMLQGTVYYCIRMCIALCCRWLMSFTEVHHHHPDTIRRSSVMEDLGCGAVTKSFAPQQHSRGSVVGFVRCLHVHLHRFYSIHLYDNWLMLHVIFYVMYGCCKHVHSDMFCVELTVMQNTLYKTSATRSRVGKYRDIFENIKKVLYFW